MCLRLVYRGGGTRWEQEGPEEEEEEKEGVR